MTKQHNTRPRNQRGAIVGNDRYWRDEALVVKRMNHLRGEDIFAEGTAGGFGVQGALSYYSLSPLLENWLSCEGSNGNFIGLLIGNQQIWILVVKSLGYGSGISDFDSPQTYHLLAGLPLASCITPMSLGFLLCKFRILLVLGGLFWGLTTTQNVCA